MLELGKARQLIEGLKYLPDAPYVPDQESYPHSVEKRVGTLTMYANTQTVMLKGSMTYRGRTYNVKQVVVRLADYDVDYVYILNEKGEEIPHTTRRNMEPLFINLVRENLTDDIKRVARQLQMMRDLKGAEKEVNSAIESAGAAITKYMDLCHVWMTQKTVR